MMSLAFLLRYLYKKPVLLFFIILLFKIIGNSTFAQAIEFPNVPKKITDNLVSVKVNYINYDNETKVGFLIVNKSVSKEIKIIFDSLFSHKFPIEKIIPLSKYDWSDELSMADNNTSAFNYRLSTNSKSKLSKHSLGLAIDINPVNNPYIKGKVTNPKNAVYNPKVKGTIVKNSYIVRLFKKYGWHWGGDWKSLKDYQHFEK